MLVLGKQHDNIIASPTKPRHPAEMEHFID